MAKHLTLEDVEASVYHNRWVASEDQGPMTRWRKLSWRCVRHPELCAGNRVRLRLDSADKNRVVFFFFNMRENASLRSIIGNIHIQNTQLKED